MFSSDEEFVMDFEAEEKRPQLGIFDIEDSITISASEAESDGCNSPTPPLLCKLKKARVLIKKLPRNVLAKYEMKAYKKHSRAPLPCRSSGRLKDRQLPIGQYLALHMNKPLSEVLNKKKKLSTQQIKSVENEKQAKLAQKKKPIEFRTKVQHNRVTRLSEKYSFPNMSTTSAKINLHAKDQEKSQVKAKKLIGPASIRMPGLNRTSQKTSNDQLRLQEKQLVSPVTSNLPNRPDVLITRYTPPAPHTNSQDTFRLNAPVNVPPTTLGNNNIQISIRPQASLQSAHTNFYNSQGIQTSVNVPPTTLGNNNRITIRPQTALTSTHANFYNRQVMQTPENIRPTTLGNNNNQMSATPKVALPTGHTNFYNTQRIQTSINVPPTTLGNNNRISIRPQAALLSAHANFYNSQGIQTAENVPPTTLGNNNNQMSVTPQLALPTAHTNFYNTQSIQTHTIYHLPSQSTVLNAGTTLPNSPSNNSPARTFTIQAFKVPHDPSPVNAPVNVESPKILIIKQQPSLRTDPLQTLIPNASYMAPASNMVREAQQTLEETPSDSETVSLAESASDLEFVDTENPKEPEVIKRIIYHTKSVQTKFTCNSSICGLIDSDEFNLNCFYCYDIFPLNKWFEFKEHIKEVHHVEEKKNQSEVDNSENYHEINASCRDINLTETVDPIPIQSTSESVLTLKKENVAAKEANTTNLVVKKLPLEPRLIAERANKTCSGPVQQLPLPSTQKIVPYPAKQFKNTVVPGQLPNIKLSNNNKIYADLTISSDSDDDNLDTASIGQAAKSAATDLEADKKTKTNQSNSNNALVKIDGLNLVLPSLPHLTIKKVFRTLPKKSINSQNAATKAPHMKEGFVKMPSNMKLQKVIKTLPKPTGQLAANVRNRPRYFVVKKVIKLPSIKPEARLHISEGMILKKVQESGKDNTKKSENADIRSQDDNEDSVPKPTRGCGIIFGVTNSSVVTEFLLKLKTFPELWRPQLITSTSANEESVRKLCFHLNSRFQLDMTEMEVRRSIQRVKDWYYRVRKDVYEHNINPANREPYKHSFKKYFDILQNFMTTAVQDANNILDSATQDQSNPSMLNEMSSEGATLTPVEHVKAPQPTTSHNKLAIVTSTNDIDNKEIKDESAESLIEFDADTLYDNESSDEEVLEPFDETKLLKKRVVPKTDCEKKKTKIYLGCFECDICKKIFKRNCDLKRHRVHHFPAQFKCATCPQRYHLKHFADKCPTRHGNIKYQRVEKDANATEPRRIWPKKIFRFNLICELCGASYRSIGSLNTHKRDKHLNQRDKCVVCNFTALSNWRIVQHQKKRHIVEPGTVEEIAKKSRARMDSKTPFSNEARQGFDWRREMRKNLQPGEKFFGCCRCKIIFNTRKEKVLHNKIEHPVTEFTVICLLCLPTNKLLLSNSNAVRRHYTDIHKVAWHEIDALVKRTKPIFDLLSKEEIELLKASANYKELLEELLKDKKLEPAKNVQLQQDDETLEAVENLPPSIAVTDPDEEANKIDEEYTPEEKVYVDGIIDHDYNSEARFYEHEYASRNEHNYNEEIVENYDDNHGVKAELHPQNTCDYGMLRLSYGIENTDEKIDQFMQNSQEYVSSIVNDLADDNQLVEENLVVEEFIDEVIDEEDGNFF